MKIKCGKIDYSTLLYQHCLKLPHYYSVLWILWHVLWKHNSNNQSNAQRFTRQSTEIPLGRTEKKSIEESVMLKYTKQQFTAMSQIHPLRSCLTKYCAFLTPDRYCFWSHGRKQAIEVVGGGGFMGHCVLLKSLKHWQILVFNFN